PQQQVSGASFTVTVQVVDDYYNFQPTHPDERVRIDTSDSYDIHPGTSIITNGQSSDQFVVTLRTAGNNHTLTAVDTNLDDPGTLWTSGTSPASGAFTVVASSASRLLVLFPGDTQVPGSFSGKISSPTAQTAGGVFSVTVRLTDQQFNFVASGTMPEVELVSNDPLEEYSSLNPNTLINGERSFSMVAKTATNDFSITASTTMATPAGTELLIEGQASGLRVWPAVAHHLEFFNLPASSVPAGTAFNVSLRVHDEYHNLISTGPNIYTGGVRFDAESTFNGGLTNPNQNPLLPPNYTFLISDAGVKSFVGGPEGNLTLFAAGSRWIEAHDISDSDISSERAGYSTQPLVYITPGAPFKFAIDQPTDLSDGVTDGVIRVSAGNLTNKGRTQIVAQLTDQFDNFISSPGHQADLSVINVIGSTGTIQEDLGGGSFQVVASTFTDSNGQVGVNPPIYYFVSTTRDDQAVVRVSSGTITGDTLPILTEGGTPSELAFINPTAQNEAGEWVAMQYTLERRDDFGNPTKETVTNASLLLPHPPKSPQGHKYRLNQHFSKFPFPVPPLVLPKPLLKAHPHQTETRFLLKPSPLRKIHLI
ncbi:hypothetical protein BVX98_01270, partial [bacterium F11]